MSPPARCPRCGGAVREPGLWSNDWRCEAHGAVEPFRTLSHLSAESLTGLAARSAVPLWLPQHPPPGWLVSGLGTAGSERSGARASVVLLSGPAPLGGPAELAMVAEQPGVGLGAALAGLPSADPGGCFDAVPPHAKVTVAGRPTPLWCLPADGCAPFVGEAKGLWLWLVAWPADAGLVLLEPLELLDARESAPAEVVFGAVSPRLGEPAPGGGTAPAG